MCKLIYRFIDRDILDTVVLIAASWYASLQSSDHVNSGLFANLQSEQPWSSPASLHLPELLQMASHHPSPSHSHNANNKPSPWFRGNLLWWSSGQTTLSLPEIWNFCPVLKLLEATEKEEKRMGSKTAGDIISLSYRRLVNYYYNNSQTGKHSFYQHCQ